MRVACITDLHIDYGSLNREILPYLAAAIEQSQPDVLVIAGDIATRLHTLGITLKALTGLAGTNLFVPGNHDVWCRSSEITPITTGCSMIRYRDAIRHEAEAAGFRYLPLQPVAIDGVGFAGTIGWYDYTFRRPDLDAQIPIADYRTKQHGRNRWYDVVCADWGAPDETVAATMESDLARDLSTLAAGTPRTIMCVTHHVPFRECVQYRDTVNWDFFSAYMGSEGLGRIMQENPLVHTAFFGHTHNHYDTTVGHVRCLCTPVGYLRERTRLDKIATRSLAVIDL